MTEVLETSEPTPEFEPSAATMNAWEAKAHILLARDSPRGSKQAEIEHGMAVEAFECMVLGTQDFLASTMRSRFGDIQHAEDILQETYLRAFKGLPKFRGDCQVETWLHKIMFNQIITFHKKEARHTKHLLRHFDDSKDEYLEDNNPIPDNQAQLIHEDQLFTGLHEALEQLSPKLKTAAFLRFVNGLNFIEIAEELGISETAAKLRIHRAKHDTLSKLPAFRKLFDK